MAKKTQDREDLLRDAKAYVRRIEFVVPDAEPVFVGFRQCGAASFYFGQAHVLQFNAANELRRAFWQDRLLASYQRCLHWLEKGDGRVRLTRTPLTAEEWSAFQIASLARVRGLEDRLRVGEYTVRGQFPAEDPVQSHVQAWLGEFTTSLELAPHPGVRQKQSAKSRSRHAL